MYYTRKRRRSQVRVWLTENGAPACYAAVRQFLPALYCLNLDTANESEHDFFDAGHSSTSKIKLTSYKK